jgi:hypothetical protein
MGIEAILTLIIATAAVLLAPAIVLVGPLADRFRRSQTKTGE